MHEYEIFIEEINPCVGEKYSKKTLIEAEADGETGADRQEGTDGQATDSTTEEKD